MHLVTWMYAPCYQTFAFAMKFQWASEGYDWINDGKITFTKQLNRKCCVHLFTNNLDFVKRNWKYILLPYNTVLCLPNCPRLKFQCNILSCAITGYWNSIQSLINLALYHDNILPCAKNSFRSMKYNMKLDHLRSFPNDTISDDSKIYSVCRKHCKHDSSIEIWKLFDDTLTHYQMTNFRLFQTERVCRQQFQIWRKWKKLIQTGRKHCGKRRNCLLRAIFPFLTVFSKGLFPRRVKRYHCVGMG